MDLEQKAKSVRKRIFEFKTKTGKGHLASCLSLVDILVSMYYDDKTNFDHTKDIVIYSKGHGSPAVYPILVDKGYIKKTELNKYCQPNGKLRLHADKSIPGCHFVGGSLGNGVGYAAGLAYGTGKDVYTILGDAELYEGSVWETFIFVAHHNINNLCMIVDRNKMGILGKTEELLKLEPLKEKFESFGLEVHEVSGHDFKELRKALSGKSKKPKIIIADTIKGKGVSYMEDVWQYHTIIPKERKLIKIAKEELSE
tara:strand:+ start:6989 stop:7753 length:765 start_codon:yes stop_codon:yes gene_type:complete